MTDITETATAMKAAAEKATPGQWVALIDTATRTFSVHTPDDKRCDDVIKWTGFDGQHKAKENAKFIALTNPANILALVGALEKAQLEISSANRVMATQDSELTSRRKRITELESRAVKLPDRKSERFWPNYGLEFYSLGYEIALTEVLAAAGIKWEAA